MYNGIGLSTVRGSGTNGFVQRNMAQLKQQKRNNLSYGPAPTNAIGNRKPNQEILQHERKRQIEVKCFELKLELEREGIESEALELRVNELREKLKKEQEEGMLIETKLNEQSVHRMAELKSKEDEKWRNALGITNYVEGAAFDFERKKEEREREKLERAEKRRAGEEERRVRDDENERKRLERKESRSREDEDRRGKRQISKSPRRESDHYEPRRRRRSRSSSRSVEMTKRRRSRSRSRIRRCVDTYIPRREKYDDRRDKHVDRKRNLGEVSRPVGTSNSYESVAAVEKSEVKAVAGHEFDGERLSPRVGRRRTPTPIVKDSTRDSPSSGERSPSSLGSLK